MSAAAGETSPNVGRPGVSTADIVVAGAAGRVGNRIIACLADTADLRLLAGPPSSGPGRGMAEVFAAARGRDLYQVAVYGRQGLPGERSRSEIGILSLRSGDVVGEHTVSFGTLGERLELVHKAHNRDTYARGALRAARFIVGRPAGLYSMADVLGLA